MMDTNSDDSPAELDGNNFVGGGQKMVSVDGSPSAVLQEAIDEGGTPPSDDEEVIGMMRGNKADDESEDGSREAASDYGKGSGEEDQPGGGVR